MNRKIKSEVSILQIIGLVLEYFALGYLMTRLNLYHPRTIWDGVLGFVFLLGLALTLLGYRFTKKFKFTYLQWLGWGALSLVFGYAGVLLIGTVYQHVSGGTQLYGAALVTIITVIVFGLQVYRGR